MLDFSWIHQGQLNKLRFMCRWIELRSFWSATLRIKPSVFSFGRFCVEPITALPNALRIDVGAGNHGNGLNVQAGGSLHRFIWNCKESYVLGRILPPNLTNGSVYRRSKNRSVDYHPTQEGPVGSNLWVWVSVLQVAHQQHHPQKIDLTIFSTLDLDKSLLR